MFLGNGYFKLFRWREVDVFMDLTALLLIFFYVAQLSSQSQGSDGLIIGFSVGILILASILIHELAHAWVGMWLGAKVERIQLSIFGGVCVFRSKLSSNWRDFLISLAGPLSNFGLYFLFNLSFNQTLQHGSAGPWIQVADYVAFINLFLGIFNILPGFPLDGGQALKALVLMITRRELWAAWVVAVTGCLVGAGIAYMAFDSSKSGSIISVIFLGMIAYWVVSASLSQLQIARQFTGQAMRFVRPIQASASPQSHEASISEGVPTGAAVKRSFVTTLSPRTTVSDFLEMSINWGDNAIEPVLLDGFLAGYISRGVAKKVKRAEQGTVILEKIMVPRRQLQAVYEDDDLAYARLLVRANRGQPVAVLDRGGSFVGFLTPADLAAFRR